MNESKNSLSENKLENGLFVKTNKLTNYNSTGVR